MIRNTKYLWVAGVNSHDLYYLRKRWAKIVVARMRGGEYSNPPHAPFGWVALVDGEFIPPNYYTRKSWAWRGADD